jgi:hypothetical protein
VIEDMTPSWQPPPTNPGHPISAAELAHTSPPTPESNSSTRWTTAILD